MESKRLSESVPLFHVESESREEDCLALTIRVIAIERVARDLFSGDVCLFPVGQSHIGCPCAQFPRISFGKAPAERDAKRDAVTAHNPDTSVE